MAGEQGRLEIIYDEVDGVWRSFISVEVEKPLYIDLGVINLATLWFEGLKQPTAFSGRNILADWWYWTKKISEEQSRIARINKAKTSKKIRRLYRIRQRRFRHAVNAMVKAIVEDAAQLGISKIMLGDLRGIRESNHKNNKANSMIHNFWSFRYIIRRFREKAEEYGIAVVEISECKTSTKCPRCCSENAVTSRRLFKRLNCGLKANRDAVGALNIGLAQGA